MRKCLSSLLTVLISGLLAISTMSSVFAAQVTEENAKSIALEHAGVDTENVSFMIAEQDTEDGVMVFEVKFVTRDYEEYEYEIQAEGGFVLSAEYERNTFPVSGTEITLDRAKEIALEHAGLEADKVTFLKQESDIEDGRWFYDVEFYTDSYQKYEYEIDQKTGEIASWDYDSDSSSARRHAALQIK
ncbi:MAG: hypothetical protein HFG54_00320 [Lachnospiraceae bacterium]|jgi:uncharacterized membrane protein YkoI|nr:hypothetical protein [Lachnospiraceae bacterium]